ncbi:MAG: hypothetical protein NT007_07560 [Candidatus Kapabacteria bacterium]|nr:hypothetical protein [Candidatus Kapabacteria bacterium]
MISKIVSLIIIFSNFIINYSFTNNEKDHLLAASVSFSTFIGGYYYDSPNSIGQEVYIISYFRKVKSSSDEDV